MTSCIMDSTVDLNPLVLKMNLALGNISLSMGNAGDMYITVLTKMCSTALLFSGLHCRHTALLSSLL